MYSLSLPACLQYLFVETYSSHCTIIVGKHWLCSGKRTFYNLAPCFWILLSQQALDHGGKLMVPAIVSSACAKYNILSAHKPPHPRPASTLSSNKHPSKDYCEQINIPAHIRIETILLLALCSFHKTIITFKYKNKHKNLSTTKEQALG